MKQLNDPYEYRCMYVDKEKFRKAGYSDEIIATFENMLQDNMTQIGVTCFSEKSLRIICLCGLIMPIMDEVFVSNMK